MAPSPDDAGHPPEPRSAGGLASVFKGLTGSRSARPHPPPAQSSSSAAAAAPPPPPERVDPASLDPRGGLRPEHRELFDQLRAGAPSERASAADGLRAAVADYPLNPVLDIWYGGKDLIESTKPPSARQAGWRLLAECAKHDASSDLERKEYFRTLSAPADPDDFHLQLGALVDLTKRGRDLAGFDYDVIPLLNRWLQDVFHAVKTARKQASSRAAKNPKGKAAAPDDEKGASEANLARLFVFVLDVIKFNVKVTDDKAVHDLILTLLNVCVSTNAEEDLRSCIAVINTIVTFGSMPNESLGRCANVLGSIFCLVPTLEKDSWHALANLCKSHHGSRLVQMLLKVLRTYPPEDSVLKDANREVRGALAVLTKLVSKSTGKGYPAVPLAVLIEGLENIAVRSPSPRVSAAGVRLINSLFDGGEHSLSPLLVDENWSRILDAAAEYAKRAGLPPGERNGSTPSLASALSSKDDFEKNDDLVVKELRTLAARLEELVSQRRSDFVQRHDCIAFFAKAHHILPDSAAGLVLGYFKEFRCCFPSDPDWEDNLKLVLESFYTNKQRSTLVRLHALEAVTAVYEMLELAGEMVDGQGLPDLVKRILAGISEETDTLLLQETVTFLVSVATTADTDLFDAIFDALRGIVANDRLRSPVSASSAQTPGPSKSSDRPGYFANQSPSNVVTRGYVQMFMRTMDTDAAKATKVFTALVNIARSNLCETDARLTSMRLLFRLRADWANRVFVTPFTESEGLAAHLFRTEAALAKKLAEDAAQATRQHRSETNAPRTTRGISFGQGQPQDRVQPSRSVSYGKPSTHKYQQLWAFPDSEALPETPASTASPVLFSNRSEGSAGDGAKPGRLNIGSWMEAIVALFQNGCDWEVYSFVLVHLPSQLSNHAILRDAVPQILDLRRLLCEQIRMNSFQEPPSSSGPRRPEVLLCLFQTLTMLLSYHEHFRKADEDELVRTFIHGLSDRTAVCCVHALSICCHELPLSMSKSLVTTLQRMSMIITRQGVAMHILEFLACLSRLHSLYSNFREDEYRIVFGICFRYLQTVRDSRRSSRVVAGGAIEQSSGPSTNPSNPDVPGVPAASEDLPQYVHALAYHVITFWFLALKLPDRANHVGWIASRLFVDNDGRQMGEEHAQITLDFMQRVAFSDANDSAEDPDFRKKHCGEVIEKRWIIGHSIVSIQQAVESGWAQITKRQPSGTSSFAIRENFGPRPAHETRRAEIQREGQPTAASSVLPSHLLVQLMSSFPQTYDSALRPIPLPDDEAVDRAVRTFDRSSSVDGHKVGVIYVGEGQTGEVEILANVSGSRDYTRFLNELGTLTRLKGANFNTQGLDREYDSDGQYTFCWRDRVTEIVFHVTTQMPTNLDHDAQCIGKKRHIGNDFVNIIFNDAGLPFRFDTFPSDFNYVNIVITPESRASFVASRETKSSSPGPGGTAAPAGPDSFYKVQVMSRPDFPEISPAAETKMVSLKALPDFIRLLALNASVFSLVWANREGGGHVSSWSNRLREINRLRDRYAPKTAPTPSPPPSSLGGAVTGLGPPGATLSPDAASPSSRPGSSVRDSFSSLRRSSVATFFTTTSEQTSHRSSVLSTATTDNTEILPLNGVDSLVDSLDFSKWA